MLVPVEERSVDRARNPELGQSFQASSDRRRLIYMCCSCNHTELADTPFVFMEELGAETSEGRSTFRSEDYKQRPIESKQCPSCGNRQAYNLGRGPTTDDYADKTRYKCATCGNEWIDEGAE